MRVALIAFFSLLLGISPAFAIDCANVGSPEVRTGYFPLICRGPLNFEMYQRNGGTPLPATEIVFQFVRAPTGGGAAGTSLPARTCAWTDRPLGAAEPTQLGIIVSDNTGSSQLTESMWTTVQACLLNSSCRVAFCATNVDRGFFLTGADERFLRAFGNHIEILRGP